MGDCRSQIYIDVRAAVVHNTVKPYLEVGLTRKIWKIAATTFYRGNHVDVATASTASSKHVS